MGEDLMSLHIIIQIDSYVQIWLYSQGNKKYSPNKRGVQEME